MSKLKKAWEQAFKDMLRASFTPKASSTRFQKAVKLNIHPLTRSILLIDTDKLSS